jgi:hypothetical protein
LLRPSVPVCIQQLHKTKLSISTPQSFNMDYPFTWKPRYLSAQQVVNKWCSVKISSSVQHCTKPIEYHKNSLTKNVGKSEVTRLTCFSLHYEKKWLSWFKEVYGRTRRLHTMVRSGHITNCNMNGKSPSCAKLLRSMGKSVVSKHELLQGIQNIQPSYIFNENALKRVKSFRKIPFVSLTVNSERTRKLFFSIPIYVSQTTLVWEPVF